MGNGVFKNPLTLLEDIWGEKPGMIFVLKIRDKNYIRERKHIRINIPGQ